MKKIIGATLLALTRLGLAIVGCWTAGVAYERGRKFGAKDVSKLDPEAFGRNFGLPVALELFVRQFGEKIVGAYMKAMPDTPAERMRKRAEARLKTRRDGGVQDL